MMKSLKYLQHIQAIYWVKILVLFCSLDQKAYISQKEATEQLHSLSEVSVTESWNMVLQILNQIFVFR